VIAGLYGSCGDLFPGSLRAELHAVVNMLRLALPPLTIWCDNQGVVDGYQKGKRWCCASTRPAADPWREFWRLIDDIGCGIVISKCNRHAAEVDVQQGRSTEFLRRGNDNADHFAGYGAGIEEHQVPNEADIVEYKLACRWYHWLAKLTEHWPVDTQFKDKQDQSEAVETAVGRPARDFELHAFVPSRPLHHWAAAAMSRVSRQRQCYTAHNQLESLHARRVPWTSAFCGRHPKPVVAREAREGPRPHGLWRRYLV